MHVYVCVYIYIYTHTYTCVYVCIYMCIYTHTQHLNITNNKQTGPVRSPEGAKGLRASPGVLRDMPDTTYNDDNTNNDNNMYVCMYVYIYIYGERERYV